MPNTLKKLIAGLTSEELFHVMKTVEELLPESKCDVLTLQLDIDKYEIIQLKDACYVFRPKSKMCAEIFMKDGRKIVYPNQICNKSVDIMQYIESKHDDFKALMNGVLININNVIAYSDYFRKVHFSDDLSLDVTGAVITYIKKCGREIVNLDALEKTNAKGMRSIYNFR